MEQKHKRAKDTKKSQIVKRIKTQKNVYTVADLSRGEFMLHKNPNHLNSHFGKGRRKILRMEKYKNTKVDRGLSSTRSLKVKNIWP